MYLLVTSKGKVLESGGLEKCLLRLEEIAADASQHYRVECVENGVIVHYKTFGPIRYIVVKLSKEEHH